MAAHINDPEVLIRLRRGIIDLAAICEQAVSQGISEGSRLEQTLRGEQLPLCRRQLHTSEQRHGEARIKYLALKNAPTKMGPQPIEEAERDYRRSKHQCDELQQRLQKINSALDQLPKRMAEPAGQARRAQQLVSDALSGTIARLDNMLDSLERYQKGAGHE